MAESVEDLGGVARLANALLAGAAPADRRKLLRRLARDLRVSQSGRIGRQREPDGEPFAPRQEPKPGKAGGYPVRFLYPKNDPDPRVCLVKRWIHAGDSFIGFDIEVGATRTFDWDKVERFLPLTAADRAKPAGPEPRRGKIRARAMFRKLRAASRLRSGGTEDEAWVGFTGRDAAIARVHQQGGEDRPSGKRAVRYPRRQLLGLSRADRDILMAGLLAPIQRA
jgi:hypothetical protein